MSMLIERAEMIDVQNQKDSRGIKIQQTGVTAVYLPFSFLIGKEFQPVLAKIRFKNLTNKIKIGGVVSVDVN